ncbi:MAG: hypothetical protein RIC16_05665 [Rhodospirillales bacterium]
MRIYRPEIHASSETKKLIRLLSRLIADTVGVSTQHRNYPDEGIPLTDVELGELIVLLTKFREQEATYEAAYLVSETFNSSTYTDPSLRKIWTKNRKRLGRSSVMSSAKWEDFMFRLGVGQNYRYAKSNPMTFRHFIKMEEILFHSAGVEPFTVEHLIARIQNVEEKLEKLREIAREGEDQVGDTAIKPLETIQVPDDRSPLSSGWMTSTNKLSAMLTVIVNTTVIFTTRDWGVTGVLSTAAGSMVNALGD